MKKTWVISLLILFAANIAIQAQTVLLEVEREEEDSLEVKGGPNTKNYTHLYFGSGLVLGEAPSNAPLIYGLSHLITYGIRYKRKVGNVYAIGCGLNFNSTGYFFKQNQSKRFPDSALLKKEKFRLLGTELEVYNRFNFDPGRGNYMGYFLDIGGSIRWNFSNSYVTKRVNSSGELVKSITRRLSYFEPFQYFLQTRVGFNRFILFGTYRISDLFKPSYNYPSLPPYVIGLEVGFY